MSSRVVFHLEATRDVAEAQNHLESQRAGSGQVFLDRLNDVLARISALPQLYGVVWQNVRAARLRRFAFVVYYRYHNDYVEVLAVMHGSRDASAWRDRA